MYLIKRDDQYWNKQDAEFHDRQRQATRFETKPIETLNAIIDGARYVRLKLHAPTATPADN